MKTLYANSQSNNYELIKVINSFEKDKVKASTSITTYITNLIKQAEEEFRAQVPNSVNLTINYHYYHQIVVDAVAQIPIWRLGIPLTEDVFSVDNMPLITIIQAFAPIPTPTPTPTPTLTPTPTPPA